MKNKITKVQKRDGSIVDFDLERISSVIFKALTATSEGNGNQTQKLTDKVVRILNLRFKKGIIPHVEQIQDIVEEILILEGLVETARAYIIYREQRRRIREAATKMDEASEAIDKYIQEVDWQVKENANMTYSLQGLNQYTVSFVSKNYWLNKIYPKEIREAAANEDFHIHNLEILACYTFFGRETVLAKLDDKIELISLKDLYEIIASSETLLNKKDKAFAKYPDNLYVLDRNGWVAVKRIVRKRKERQMRFIKSEQGRSVIVTDNHPFISKSGQKEIEIIAAKVKEKKDFALSVFLPDCLKSQGLFGRKYIYLAEELMASGQNKFFLEGMPVLEFISNWKGDLKVEGTISASNNANCLDNKLNLNTDLGYLAGIFIAEGNYSGPRLVITNSDQKIIERVQRICNSLGVRSYLREVQGRVAQVSINNSALTLVFKQIFRIKDLSQNKNLPPEVLTYNLDFVRGLIAGIIDGNGTVDPDNKANGASQVLIRVSSRTMLEQIAILLQFFGIIARDGAAIEDIGKVNLYRGKKIVQNYPIYRLVFSKKSGVDFPSFKYKEAQVATKSWRTDKYGWNKILCNKITTIPDEEIYDITTASGTFLCNGLLVHNCMGWDLYDLLQRGFGGAPGKIESRPPKHFRTALGQLVNFFFTVQGESAGAQAVSNFDTLLAPFIRYDNLNYPQIKQAMQEFLYNCMVPTRVGFQCLSEDTEILTPSGWKNYQGIIKGDQIYTFNPQTKTVEIKPTKMVFSRKYEGKMYNLKNRSQDQLISPGHRVVREIFNTDQYKLEPIEDILKLKTLCYVPTRGENNNSDLDISDEQLKLIAWTLAEGSIEKDSSQKVFPSFLYKLSQRQARLFLATYIKGDGWQEKYRQRITVTDKNILAGLEAVAVLAGYNFNTKIREPRGISKKRQYIITLTESRRDCIQQIREIDYKGVIWSVHTENETVVAKRNGQVFITGNTPFLNVSMDIKVPEFYKDQPVIIGGQAQQETYGEFQEEMNLLVKAFYECMIEGDARGRVFTFPIPTVSISKDFDWDNPALDTMWQATAKYGINYFSNFINSEMKPDDVKSMCPLGGDEKVLIKSSQGRGLEYSTIKFLYKGHSKQEEYSVYSDGGFVRGRFNEFKNQKMLQVVLANNHKIEMSEEHLNLTLTHEHSGVETLTGKQLTKGMYLPYSLSVFNGVGGNKDIGYFIGAYAGDGSFDGETTVVFSLSKDGKQSVAKNLQNIGEKYFGAHSVIKPDSKTKLLTLKIHSRAAVGLCKDFVAEKARNKHYTAKVFGMSEDFRWGVIDGHLAIDGGNRNRIYTSSRSMVETLNMLAATLGTTTSVYKDDRDNRLGKEANFAVLIYRLNRSKLKNIWFKKENKLWMRIKSVEYLPKATAYCLEVNEGEPIFTIGTTGILTHNCRLRLDKRELYKRGGGLFGSAPLTGSIGVVTINMPRIGYLSKTKKEFFARLDQLMDLAKESLELKRKALENFIEKGLYPYSKHYLAGVKKIRNSYFGNHFSTIGLLGMNEALENFLGVNIASKKGKKFALETVNFMKSKMVAYQEETGNLYNLEATPAEGTSFRQAKHDREFYPEIITAGTKQVPYYTNSTQLPVNYTDDIFEALKLQDELQCSYTGGTVLHLFLGEQVSDIQSAKALVKKIFEKYHLPYITLTPTFSVCPSHGYLAGEHFECPHCAIKQPCEVYSRIVGYIRPVNQFHIGKQLEFHQRKTFKITAPK